MNKIKIYLLRKKSLHLILLLLIAKTAISQTGVHLMNDPIPGSTGLTSISPMQKSYNPSVLIRTTKPALSVSISPSRFGLSELSPGYMLFSYPFSKDLTAAISGFGIGNELYNEISGGFHSAYSISENMAIGCSFEYYRLSIEDFKDDDSYQIHLGAVFDINDYMSAGVVVKNINNGHYQGGDKYTSQYGNLSMGFIIAKEFKLDAGVQISTIGQSGFSLAASYAIEKILKFRIAALSNPRIVSGGVSIVALPYIDIISMSNYHDFLGWSHSFGLSVYFE